MGPRYVPHAVVLYRLGYPYTADCFWATDRDYPAYIHRDSTAPLWQARLAPEARVERVAAISTSAIRGAKSRDLDGIVCACWDWPGDEYVLFDPQRVLVDIRHAEVA